MGLDQKSTTALSAGRILRAARFSCQGLASAWRDEPAFKQECAFFAALAPVTILLGLPRLETAFLLTLMLLVLACELLNSGLEALVDKTSPEYHPLAGKAKDCGSAAVLVAFLALAMAWLVLAGPAAWTIMANLGS